MGEARRKKRQREHGAWPLDLTHHLAKDFDGVIHWARDTGTFQPILKSFIRLDWTQLHRQSFPMIGARDHNIHGQW